MKRVLKLSRETRMRLLGASLLGASLLVLFLIFNLRLPNAAAASPETQSQQNAAEQTSDEDAAALTIYNQNFFVAREHVPLDLKPGVNEAQYTGVAAHLEPDSVVLRDPRGRALQILEQNYRNDPVSQ
jgi:hypothetical protein